MIERTAKSAFKAGPAGLKVDDTAIAPGTLIAAGQVVQIPGKVRLQGLVAAGVVAETDEENESVEKLTPIVESAAETGAEADALGKRRETAGKLQADADAARQAAVKAQADADAVKAKGGDTKVIAKAQTDADAAKGLADAAQAKADTAKAEIPV